MNGAPISIKSG